MKIYYIAYFEVPTSYNPRTQIEVTEKNLAQLLEIMEGSIRRLRFKPPYRDSRVISQVYCVTDGQKIVHMQDGGFSSDRISHELEGLVSQAKPDILAEGMR